MTKNTSPGASLDRFVPVAVVAGPGLTAAYGIIRAVSHHHAPGAAWLGGHSLFLLGLACFVPVLLELRRRSRPGVARAVVLGLAQFGLACSMAQIAVDLWAAAGAADRDAMDAVYRHVDAVPGAGLALYSVGPLCFYLGLFVLTALSDLPRRCAPLVLLGSLTPVISLDLLPLAAVLLMLGLAPLATTRRSRPADEPGRPVGRTSRGRSAGPALPAPRP